MGKKSRRARGGGRRGTPTSTNSKVVSLTRHLLDDDEKIKRGYADGTLTINTLRTVEPTLRTAVARALGVDEEGIAAAVKATLLMYLDESMDKKNEAAKRKATMTTLSAGAVEGIVNEIITSDGGDRPVLQVAKIQPIVGGNETRYKMWLTDGSRWVYAMAVAQVHALLQEGGDFAPGCLVRLLKYSANDMAGRKIIIVIDLEVAAGPQKLIGAPTGYPNGEALPSDAQPSGGAPAPQVQKKPAPVPARAAPRRPSAGGRATMPPPPPASESVAGPWCKARGPQAQRIAIALAMAKAAAKDVTPKEKSSENTRFSTALFALRDAIVTDDDDVANFDEYMYSHYLEGMEAEQYVKAVARWPRLRKHWPRMRRRICSNCGKRSDPSEPRLLVCGGCGEGRGVGRYCSEACQREHWPEHQKSCMRYHEYTGKAHGLVETKAHRMALQTYLNENRAEGWNMTTDHILRAALKNEIEMREA